MRRVAAEARLVILACREPDAESDELASLAGRVDRWDRVVVLARRHRVSGRVLERLAGLKVPREARDALRSDFVTETARVTYLQAALRSTLAALASARCPTIVLKGPALAVQDYGEAAQRPYDDLDLLVREVDFERAARALTDLGYRCGAGGSLPRRRSQSRRTGSAGSFLPTGSASSNSTSTH